MLLTRGLLFEISFFTTPREGQWPLAGGGSEGLGWFLDEKQQGGQQWGRWTDSQGKTSGIEFGRKMECRGFPTWEGQ